MKWQPIETYDPDKHSHDILAVREGYIIWQVPDESGFLSGCDQGPDVFEENIERDVVRAFWCNEPQGESPGFVDDNGYHYVRCGIAEQMYDPDVLDAPFDGGKKPLRLTFWQPTPEPPGSEARDPLINMTDDQRMEVFSNYCRHCGSDNPACQCWNDE